MTSNITFLGAVGTVTGSKYLIETGDRKILVDCGLFQGFKQLRLRNWAPLPIAPKDVHAVVLTHAHLDHTGYLPLFVRNGFSGPVICTPATRDLCGVLLPDSGYLQEKDAEFANRHGFSRHRPALPLYTRKDAVDSLDRLRPIPFGANHEIGSGVAVRLLPAGHILGAAIVVLHVGDVVVTFSGDLGSPNSPTMLDPARIRGTDYLVVESTYGDRSHDSSDPEDVLAGIINGTISRGGTVLVPAFAVGRAQTLLFYLYRLKSNQRIPGVPVFLDSPMAVNASEIFCNHLEDHKLTAKQCRAVCTVSQYVRDAEQSKALNEDNVPKIIISASGMATGGRVLHHLKRYAPERRNTILFTGFQAGGTRGAALTAGAESVKIHGQYVPVRAEVQNLQMLSAHADANHIVEWLRSFEAPPQLTFITHGEPAASDALRRRIDEQLGWRCCVPEYRERVRLT